MTRSPTRSPNSTGRIAGQAALLILPALALGYVAGRHGGSAPPPAASPAPPAAVAAPALNPDFIKTALPQRQDVAQSIAVTGKLGPDQRRVRIAAARVAGRLGRIFVFEGQSVKAGAPLAEIYSPDFVSAENELLLARRFRDAAAQGNNADGALRDDTGDAYRAAGDRLRTLGASDADIAALERDGRAQQYLLVRAPISGVVTQRNVDPGGYLNLGDALMTLADLDALWLSFDTYDADYPSLRLGQTLRFGTSSLPGEAFEGRVGFIAPALDATTHTLPVRCDIDNPGMRLRPGMFVSGRLLTGSAPAWVVPQSAVLHQGERDYLFVLDGGRYRRLEVRGQAQPDGTYAIVTGLEQPLPVVVEGAVLLQEQQAGEAEPAAG